jgi:hypothetical protein
MSLTLSPHPGEVQSLRQTFASVLLFFSPISQASSVSITPLPQLALQERLHSPAQQTFESGQLLSSAQGRALGLQPIDNVTIKRNK